MCKATIQVLFLWINFVFVPLLNCQPLLSKKECDISSSCYSIPSGCTSSDDCSYFLKYSVDNQNVIFELSSNTYEWISLGFNSEEASMKGGKSLVCETHQRSKIVLKHYDMPERTYPDESEEVKATLLSSKIENGVLYCKFSRQLDAGSDRVSLNKPVYFLYAAGNMDTSTDKIAFHRRFKASLKPVNVSLITDNSDKSQAQKRIDTIGCGKTTSCLRDPKTCRDNRDCNYLVVFKKNGSNVEFSMSGKADGWISVGFNDKPKMGGTDSVICLPNSNGVTLWTSKLDYDRPTLEKPSNETPFLEGVWEGGVLYCKFSRPLSDIGSPKYVIYGRGGGTLLKLKKHNDDGRGCSEKKVDFSSNMKYKLGDCHLSDLSKVHGSFMIFSWMFLVVISIFIARYSRSLWGSFKILGKDVWFQVHRSTMGLAVLLTIIAIIIIFVDREGWSESAGDHAVFGIIVLVLAIIQPTIALFRPHSTAPRRPIFNWFHRIVALSVFILAVVSVFKGAHLLEDNGGDVAAKLLIALLVIAFITALILEFLAFRIGTQLSYYTTELSSTTGEVKLSENSAGKGFNNDVSHSIWEMKAQRVLLAVLSLVVFILAITMIAYVGGAGSDDDDDDDDD